MKAWGLGASPVSQQDQNQGQNLSTSVATSSSSSSSSSHFHDAQESASVSPSPVSSQRSYMHQYPPSSPPRYKMESVNGGPPQIKLLQSCDFCRRRKVKCDGTKPTCSTCVRHKVPCHYSPLTIPRRRSGKRNRDVNGASNVGESQHSSTPQLDSDRGHNNADVEELQRADAKRIRIDAVEKHQRHSQRNQSDDILEMRQEMHSLRTEFSNLSQQMERLTHLLTGHKLQGNNNTMAGLASPECMSNPHFLHGSDIPHNPRKTSIIEEINMKHAKLQDKLMESYPEFKLPPGFSPRPLSQMGQSILSDNELCNHLIDTFYEFIDPNTKSYMPRSILLSLKAVNRAPKTLLYAIMADASMHSDHPSIIAFTRQGCRALFLEQAYRESIDCMRYDSLENCVTLLIFGLVVSRAGFPRAWLMPTVAFRMMMRMRLYMMDSSRFRCIFEDNTLIQREWKRRVFWGMFGIEMMISTAGTTPCQLYIEDIQCDLPKTLQEAGDDEEMAAVSSFLGPPLIFYPCNQTFQAQYQLASLLSRINRYRNQIHQEKDGLFGIKFREYNAELEQWRVTWHSFVDHDAILRQNYDEVEDKVQLLNRIHLCSMFHFIRIALCLRKEADTGEISKLSEDNAKALEWSRHVVYESSNIIMMFCPLLNRYSEYKRPAFFSVAMYFSGLISVFACSWFPRPEVVNKAVSDIEAVFNFMERVTKSWGFSSDLITSLRRVIIECDLGSKLKSNVGADGRQGSEKVTDLLASVPTSPREYLDRHSLVPETTAKGQEPGAVGGASSNGNGGKPWNPTILSHIGSHGSSTMVASCQSCDHGSAMPSSTTANKRVPHMPAEDALLQAQSIASTAAAAVAAATTASSNPRAANFVHPQFMQQVTASIQSSVLPGPQSTFDASFIMDGQYASGIQTSAATVGGGGMGVAGPSINLGPHFTAAHDPNIFLSALFNSTNNPFIQQQQR